MSEINIRTTELPAGMNNNNIIIYLFFYQSQETQRKVKILYENQFSTFKNIYSF